MARFIGATWLGNGVSGGSILEGKPKFVIHITVTRSLPGYANGKKAPHFTDHPADGRTYQHTDTSTGSRALQNRPGGVQTNRAGHVIQLEIVAYESRAKAQQHDGIWIGDITDTDYERIAKLVRWAHDTHGVPYFIRTPRIRPTGDVGPGAPRMSESEWQDFSGICGHFEVPENDPKWDPCAFDFERLLALLVPAEPTAQPLPDPVPEPFGDEMTTEQFVKRLTPARIDELVESGVILGDPNGLHWKEMLADPANPEWEDVMEEIEVMSRLRAATRGRR